MQKETRSASVVFAAAGGSHWNVGNKGDDSGEDEVDEALVWSSEEGK